MTLCVVWRDANAVHFLSDSRLTIKAGSFADVGIKVLGVPYRVYSPSDHDGNRTLDFAGDLGMCFAGSAVNSLCVKETVADILLRLQHVPGHTDVSMDAISRLLFRVYRSISSQVCSTALAEHGRAAIVIAGPCRVTGRVRAYSFDTDDYNESSCVEILTGVNEYRLIGAPTARKKVEACLPTNPQGRDFLTALRLVIADASESTVGGAIQYGVSRSSGFQVWGVSELRHEDPTGVRVCYWRGGVDLNSPEFLSDGELVPSFNYLASSDESVLDS